MQAFYTFSEEQRSMEQVCKLQQQPHYTGTHPNTSMANYTCICQIFAHVNVQKRITEKLNTKYKTHEDLN